MGMYEESGQITCPGIAAFQHLSSFLLITEENIQLLNIIIQQTVRPQGQQYMLVDSGYINFISLNIFQVSFCCTPLHPFLV